MLLVSCDVVTTVSLHTLTLFHHAHHSTFTALVLKPPSNEDDTLRRKPACSVVERDLIGLADESRIVLFAAQADLEENLMLSRSMLQQLVLNQFSFVWKKCV